MAKALQDLLGNDHPLFAVNMSALERAAGNSGVDVRLIADITELAHAIMRRLGLDPADTTSVELYQALDSTVHTGQAETLLADASFVLLNLGDGPISFNVQDVVDNFHHELAFADRTTAHAQRHLRSEVVKRYADHDRTDNKMIRVLAKEIGLERVKPASSPSDASQAPPLIFSVGDIFTDAFIKLRDESARIDTDPDGSKRLSLPFGSKPPYERVDIVQAVGPSPNAAVSFARLGLGSGLLAFLGDDKPGRDSLAYLEKERVDTSLVSVQKNMMSNYYYALRYGAKRTLLIKDEAYDYAWQEPKITPDWIYLSLLSETSWQLHEDLLTYLHEHDGIKLAFQPGTFHFSWGVEKLAGIYARSYIVVMNREEAVDVTGKSYDVLKDLADGLHALGPKIVVITDGPKGSYASYDGKLLTIPNYPDPAPPLDRTGAGDAFASTLVAALALGKPLEVALQWAPINSMSVVQQIGAQAGLLQRDEIETLLARAPSDYQAKELLQ